MELLIPGLILVGLMVYASTRIKRVAAEAFEAETVENEWFSIEKPEGFLNVIAPPDGLEFEAYSKDFGVGEAAEFKAARLEARVYRNRNLKYAVSALREAVGPMTETPEVIDGRKYVLIEAESVEKGVGFREVYKLAEKDGSVVELKARSLEDISEDLGAKVEAMIASFIVK